MTQTQPAKTDAANAQNFFAVMDRWLKNNAAQATRSAIQGAILGYVTSFALSSLAFGWPSSFDGAKGVFDGLVRSSIFCGLFTTIAFSLFGYMRAVGPERFFNDIERFPSIIAGLFRQDGRRGLAHFMWGCATGLISAEVVSPWIGGVTAIGFVAAAPSVVGRAIANMLRNTWSSLTQALSPTKALSVDGSTAVVVGMLGASATLLVAGFISEPSVKLFAAVGCAVLAFGIRAASGSAAVILLAGLSGGALWEAFHAAVAFAGVSDHSGVVAAPGEMGCGTIGLLCGEGPREATFLQRALSATGGGVAGWIGGCVGSGIGGALGQGGGGGGGYEPASNPPPGGGGQDSSPPRRPRGEGGGTDMPGTERWGDGPGDIPTPPRPEPAPEAPPIFDPFNQGKALTTWKAGLGPGSDGQAGRPGDVWWQGRWVDPQTARDGIKTWQDQDRQRDAAAAAFDQEAQDKSAAQMRKSVEDGERDARARQDAQSKAAEDAKRRAALQDGIDNAIDGLDSAQKRRELTSQLADLMNKGDTEGVEALWKGMRGARQSQLDAWRAEADSEAFKAQAYHVGEFASSAVLVGSKVVLAVGTGGLVAQVGFVAAAAGGSAALGSVFGIERGIVPDGEGGLTFDPLEGAKGFAGGTKVAVTAAIGGVKTAGKVMVGAVKVGSQAALDTIESYAHTGEIGTALRAGAISTIGNTAGELVGASAADAIKKRLLGHAVNMGENVAQRVNQGEEVANAVIGAATGEALGAAAHGVVGKFKAPPADSGGGARAGKGARGRDANQQPQAGDPDAELTPEQMDGNTPVDKLRKIKPAEAYKRTLAADTDSKFTNPLRTPLQESVRAAADNRSAEARAFAREEGYAELDAKNARTNANAITRKAEQYREAADKAAKEGSPDAEKLGKIAKLAEGMAATSNDEATTAEDTAKDMKRMAQNAANRAEAARQEFQKADPAGHLRLLKNRDADAKEAKDTDRQVLKDWMDAGAPGDKESMARRAASQKAVIDNPAPTQKERAEAEARLTAHEAETAERVEDAKKRIAKVLNPDNPSAFVRDGALPKLQKVERVMTQQEMEYRHQQIFGQDKSIRVVDVPAPGHENLPREQQVMVARPWKAGEPIEGSRVVEVRAPVNEDTGMWAGRINGFYSPSTGHVVTNDSAGTLTHEMLHGVESSPSRTEFTRETAQEFREGVTEHLTQIAMADPDDFHLEDRSRVYSDQTEVAGNLDRAAGGNRMREMVGKGKVKEFFQAVGENTPETGESAEIRGRRVVGNVNAAMQSGDMQGAINQSEALANAAVDRRQVDIDHADKTPPGGIKIPDGLRPGRRR